MRWTIASILAGRVRPRNLLRREVLQHPWEETGGTSVGRRVARR
ncbi:hypothetical protein FM112_04305 [Gulosibacter sp. 10]|nr:hypothetical protein FM112_04305 [Gulosibacter sp. 10]